MLVRAGTSSPLTRSRSSATTTSRSRSPRVQTSIAYDPGMDEDRRGGRLRSFVIGGGVRGAPGPAPRGGARRRGAAPPAPAGGGGVRNTPPPPPPVAPPAAPT